MAYANLTRPLRRTLVVPLFFACSITFTLLFLMAGLGISPIWTILFQGGLAIALLLIAVALQRWHLRLNPSHTPPSARYTGPERRRQPARWPTDEMPLETLSACKE